MSNAGGAAASWNPRRATSTTPAPTTASAPTSTARAPKPAGYKKGYAYIAPVAPAAAFPRWVPERKGTLPERRAVPPLPPIMDSPWFVPRKKKILGGGGGGGGAGGGAAGARGGSVGAASATDSGTGSTLQGGAEGGGADGSVEGASDDDDGEDERAKALGRSVALHRPRRGGLDMKPFDVSLLWD